MKLYTPSFHFHIFPLFHCILPLLFLFFHRNLHFHHQFYFLILLHLNVMTLFFAPGFLPEIRIHPVGILYHNLCISNTHMYLIFPFHTNHKAYLTDYKTPQNLNRPFLLKIPLLPWTY